MRCITADARVRAYCCDSFAFGVPLMRTQILLIAAAATVALSACVSNPGVMQDGPDAYRIMAVGSTGFSSSGNMHMKIYKQATEFCSAKGRVVQTISTETQQAHAMGGFPEATLLFRCVVRTQDALSSR